MPNIPSLINKNAERWQGMILDPNRIPKFDAIARRVCEPDARARYQNVTGRLGALGLYPVPWWFTAIVSVREYGGPPIWHKQLGQGDPLDQRSRNVPSNRGPFTGPDAWERCAVDALADCAPKAARWGDWSPGGVMTLFEAYNGYGYASKGVPSAYVWSGSDQYVSGKYVADHVYRANVKDVQEGCAPILKRMMLLDHSIMFPGQRNTPIPQTPLTLPLEKGLMDELLAALDDL